MTGEDHLSPELLEQLARDLLASAPELQCDAALHDKIVTRVKVEEGNLASVLGSEIAAVNAARRTKERWSLLSRIAILTESIALLALLVALIWYSTLIPLFFALFTLPLLFLGYVLGVRLRSLRVFLLADAELRSALRVPLRASIRLAISELDGPEARWSNVLRTTEAPALVELNIQDTVPSRSHDRLKEFIVGHESSAIGLAGPRGSGKTTLMRQLENDASLRLLVATVSAPVHYTPDEFTHIIHRRLAEAGLDAARQASGKRRVAWRPALREAIAALSLMAVVVLLWQYDRNPKSFQPEWWHLGLLVALAFAWHRFHRRAKPPAEPNDLAELCRRQLTELRTTTTVEASERTALMISRSGVEGTSKLTRAERPQSHAEAVQRLRRFIESVVAFSGGSVLICVDELDKMARPEDAVDAINGIKDLFHISGCHFVLSVSTDALHAFAARGVPVRDAFDSAFDTIVPIRPLAVDESRTLIARRAVDFSAAAALFCHAWSGGHARDLIRTARSCVEHRARFADPEQATVAAIAERVLRDDVKEVVDAAVERLHREDDRTSAWLLDGIVAFRESLDGLALHDAIDRALDGDLLPRPNAALTSPGQRLATALRPYARLAALCRELFAEARKPEQWQGAAVLAAVEALAAARCSLDRPPTVIERRLERAEAACAAA